MLQANISAANLFYIGDCLRRVGAPEEATHYFKRALTLPAWNRVDQKGRAEAKRHLLAHGFTELELNSLKEKAARRKPSTAG